MPGHESEARWTARLKQQAGDVRLLTEGLDDAALERRPIPDKWSLKEIVAHLWRVQQVFDQRLRAMLKQTDAPLESYDPDEDRQYPAMLESRASELIEGFFRERGSLVERLETLGPDDWKRTGKHPEYRHYDIEFLVESMAFHEAHHIYQMFQRRAEL